MLAELARVSPEATRVFTGGGESGLHLCVKHNRLEALKVLVECVGGDDEFVNWRDSDGNYTVLHAAVARKQLEVYFLIFFSQIMMIKIDSAPVEIQG